MPMKIQFLSYFVILFLETLKKNVVFGRLSQFIVLCTFLYASKFFLYKKEPNSMKVRSKSEQRAKVHRVWFLGSTKE